MQLDRIVHFHKTIGDKTRINIISMLKPGPLHGQALAEKLGLTPPTISYHMTKLKEIDVVFQRRDKNTIYFYLNEKKLKAMAEAILHIGKKSIEPDFISIENKNYVITQFFNDEGKLINIPAKHVKKLIVLEYLIQGLKMNQSYEEKELNEYIKQFYDDYATIRRELIMCHFMSREHGKYELNPKEIWHI